MAISYLKTKADLKEIPLWVPVAEVESQALDQLRNIASLPWIAKMAVMPDVHLGKGATVGSVIAMRGAISPAAVGVDIGCGMGAVRTNLDVDKVIRRAPAIRADIEAAIPVGFNKHENFSFHHVPDLVKNEAVELMSQFNSLSPKVQKESGRAAKQIGTLGGGNHFIEINRDSNNAVWLMLHSGSRWIGKELAEIHTKVAMSLGHNVGIQDKALAAFLSGTPEMEAYRQDLYWAQRYAMVNRKLMMWLLKEVIAKFFPSLKTDSDVWCHHNYVAEETHYDEHLFVTRKGAIRAATGDMGIIPGAIGAKSYIVRGKGCAEALNSAPHGAGRQMSRGQAKRTFTMKDFVEQTHGVECRKDKGMIDEIRGSYKDIDKVIHYSNDLVEVVHELQPALICVKG